jgi:post-segregation antitoxin (ccd killing protein)
MYFSLAGTAMRDSELEKIAAVAESAATTRWREEPKTANATSASSTV